MAPDKNLGVPEHSLKDLMNEARLLADDQEFTKVNGRIYGELGGVIKYLNSMMEMMESVKDPMSQASHQIKEAACLGNVNKLTEEGTHRVLECAEKVNGNLDQLGEEVESILGQSQGDSLELEAIRQITETMKVRIADNKNMMMDLITALGFQDLAGQRINKMETILKEVQSRVLGLLFVFGLKDPDRSMDSTKEDELINKIDESSKTETLNQNLVDDVLKELGF